VREDPKRRGQLYAATERGVYISFDDGAHWQSLQLNLPRTSVRDIDVHGDDVVIATHGRGFWVLDDIASLRQMGLDPSHEATRLFAPSVTIRVRAAGFTGTPLPKDEPTTVNPPFGARIDYMLATSPKQSVQLAILDANGQLVRRYSSADAPPKHDPTKAGIAPEWFVAPSILATTPGLHRFIWPLRYPTLPALAEGSAYADGAWAPPGHYTVELTVDGQAYKQPLTVVPDPRVKLPDDTYAQQFAFARSVEASQALLAAASGEAGQLHDASLVARKQPDPTFADAYAALDAKVVGIAGIIDAPNPNNAWAMSPKSTSTLRFLASALDKLANAADDADAPPSPDARTGYAALMPMLERALDNWAKLKAEDLAALNSRLRTAGKPTLSVAPPAK
jgi:hypothetical protein